MSKKSFGERLHQLSSRVGMINREFEELKHDLAARPSPKSEPEWPKTLGEMLLSQQTSFSSEACSHGYHAAMMDVREKLRCFGLLHAPVERMWQLHQGPSYVEGQRFENMIAFTSQAPATVGATCVTMIVAPREREEEVGKPGGHTSGYCTPLDARTWCVPVDGRLKPEWPETLGEMLEGRDPFPESDTHTAGWKRAMDHMRYVLSTFGLLDAPIEKRWCDSAGAEGFTFPNRTTCLDRAVAAILVPWERDKDC